MQTSRRYQIADLTPLYATYVAACMRDHDREEIAPLWDAWDTRIVGLCSVECSVPGFAWAVLEAGQPIACYGLSYASAMDTGLWQAWAYGTPRFRRAVPLISRHMLSIRHEIARHCHRLQVISRSGHDIAHDWVQGLGARHEGTLRGYGRDGSDYELYAWTR